MTTTPPLLTKREYFAAQAMQGLLSNHITDAHNEMGSPVVASFAVEYADALLAELAATAPAPAPPMTYGPPPPGYYESQEALRKALAAEYATPGPIGSTVGEPAWTLYDGGPMPCAPSTLVQVKYRCGEETATPDRADYYLWSWTDEPYDIVAWRKA